jgi:hypothetical protein
MKVLTKSQAVVLCKVLQEKFLTAAAMLIEISRSVCFFQTQLTAAGTTPTPQDPQHKGRGMTWYPPRAILDRLGATDKYPPACGTGGMLTDCVGFILSNPPFSLVMPPLQPAPQQSQPASIDRHRTKRFCKVKHAQGWANRGWDRRRLDNEATQWRIWVTANNGQICGIECVIDDFLIDHPNYGRRGAARFLRHARWQLQGALYQEDAPLTYQ